MNNLLPLHNGKLEERGIIIFSLPKYFLEVRDLLNSDNLDIKNILLRDIIRDCFKNKINNIEFDTIDLIIKYKDDFNIVTTNQVNQLLINIRILCNEIKSIILALNIENILALEIESSIIKIIYKRR
jgi:hypothetical protein